MSNGNERDPLLEAEGDEIHGHAEPERHLGVAAAVSLMINKMIGTGIFSIPSSIYTLTGSVGWALVIWIVGGFIAYAGLNVYLEFGIAIPRSGSEKNYLERIYRKPKHLALCMFAVSSVFLSLSTGNCYVFGLYLLIAFGIDEPSVFATRSIAVGCISFALLLHIRFPRAGRAMFTALGMFKVVSLAIMVISCTLVFSGTIDIGPLPDNWEKPFQNDGFGGGVYNFAIALLRVFFSYRGWDSCNNVMGEIIDPAKTMGIAGPLAVGSMTFLYTLCNIAYFVVIPKSEVASSGVIIAASYFRIIFGDSVGSKLLPMLIALSNLGNVLVVTYACGRVNRELAKHNLLPFSRIIASLRPYGTPAVGLFIHWFATVCVLVIPPPGQIYEFVTDLSTYPLTLIHFAVTAGLLYLQFNHKKEHWGEKPDSYHSPLILTLVYLIANLFLMTVPWLKPNYWPPNKLPYWSVPVTSIIILCGIGPAYWWYWSKSVGREKLDEEIAHHEYVRVD